ncbi:hypothetical protein EPUL_000685 [Erysiphe pulchra]|uniref:LEM-like domain-containing protein n=1 Tax=Erysiphe pulchra TaxID=225359 RepID=A0A2S4Q0L8_9PEZI|nr:hypothetical protein EPUL_000685 [Erysiphe pulchra]
MSDTDSLDYLQADFDPTSLTVPRLRSILVNYDISYPSTAKKAQLVKIFVEEILPQRGRILKERERARRSSRGISNANSRQSIEVEQDIVPLSRSSRRNTRNTISRLQVDEQGDDGANSKKERTSSPVKRTPRASSKHARASDTETGLDPEARRKSLRTKKSETPSHYQPEPVAPYYDFSSELPKVKKEERRDSAFTYDNPFQSGSSPSSGKSPDSRRKSQGIPKERRKISNSVRRRRTEIPQINDDIYPPSSSVFEAPITTSFSRVSDTFRQLHENVIEPGEEFTPEEQSELIREKATATGKPASTFRKNRKTQNSPNFTGPFWVMILVTLIGYSIWYRQEKTAVGYCDVGREASPLISIPNGMPNWARILLEPSCEPCPHHAYCLARMVVECEKDYLLKPHPLSLAGIIPLAPTCEPDGVKVRKVKAVADRATELLREKRAKFECGVLDDAGAPISSPEVDANDLKEEVSKKRRKDMPESEYNIIWTGALEEMTTRNEVKTTVDE